MKKSRKIRDVINKEKFRALLKEYRNEYFRTTGWKFDGQINYLNGWVVGFTKPIRVADLKSRIKTLKKAKTVIPPKGHKHEIWADIIGFDGYRVSNLGRVLRIFEHNVFRLKACTTRIDGYQKVTLNTKANKLLHVIVATAFCPNPLNKPFVNHINFDRSDNRAVNLEWVTALENTAHTKEHGRFNTNSPMKPEIQRLKAENEMLKNGKNEAMRIAMEYGYKQCEKGNNLDMAFINFNKLISQ